MTRRKFIKSVLKTVSAITIGTYCGISTLKFLPAKAKATAGQISDVQRRFIRAVRQKKYLGSIKPLSDINTQGKWRG